jgi:hypothetical protein
MPHTISDRDAQVQRGGVAHTNRKEAYAMKMIHVTQSGEVAELDIRDMLDAKERVGGWIEIVHPARLPKPYVMLVDEEGRLKYRLPNAVGCYFYETDIHGQPIVGNILICAEGVVGKYGELDSLGLTDAQAEEVKGIIQKIKF